MSDESEVPEGIVAGKYRLTKLLGRGGMGSVWEGVHVELGTRVAVKFIDQAHASSDEIRNRFVNEAKAAAQLRSKHVVQVYDQGVTPDGRPYIVMEFLEGEPLDARLDRADRLSVVETATILQQVARALTKAHELGIVHRDLKPENVFLVWDHEDHRDVAKVVDFGIAKFTDAQATGSSGSTRTGAVLGTPHYMSPEQARGLRTVDSRTDVWSLGVIAFRCVTGTLPFEGEAVGDLLVKICTAEAPVPSELTEGVPPGFDAWMARALSKDVGARFQSATELADALAEVAGLERRQPMSGPATRGAPPVRTASSTPDGTQAPLATTVHGSTSRAPVLIGLAVSALLAVAGAAAVLTSRGAADEIDPGAEPPPSAAPSAERPAAIEPPVASERQEPAVAPEVAQEGAVPSSSASAEPPPVTPPVKTPLSRPAPRRAPAVPAPTPKAEPTPAPAPRPKPKPDLLGY